MRTVGILWRSTHPGPTLVVTVLSLALGVSVGLDALRLAVLVVSVFCGQLSIGLSNDVIDAARDRQTGRTDKPLALPGAPVRAAWIAAIGTAVLALGLSAALGWQLALAHAVFLGSGWAYNAALKSTVWSAACFVIGFGAFATLAPLALPAPVVAPPWALIAGAALGVAVHFSNVLPDLEDDEATGVRGLPHRLGRRASSVIACATLIAGATAVLVGPLVTDDRTPAIAGWVGFVAVVAVAVWGLVVSLAGPARRLSFRLVMTAALLLAVQLVVTGGLAG